MTAGTPATPQPPATPVARGRGVIHDLGYARYAGERRSPATLWRVIMRQHLSYAWKTKWRLKPWLLMALIITVIVGGFMYLQTNEIMRALKSVGKGVRILDGALPRAYEFYRMAAFMVSMTIGAAVIARDQESGAFTFYFARPVRPLDYVVGKLTASFILMAMIFLAGPVALACFRIGLSASTEEAIEQLVILPKVLAIGGLGSLVFSTLPLAVSALAGRRTLALGVWAGYYIAGTTMIAGIGAFTWPPLMAIDPGSSMSSLAMGLFELEATGSKLPPMWAAVASMLVQSGLSIWIVASAVKRQAEGAVGGSS